MAKNQNRFDLSDKLIHFTRAACTPDDHDPPPLPFDWPTGALVETVPISPFFLLRQILRTGKLVPTWSIRNDRRTIYGNRPAVCFTEMPLAAFLSSSRERSRKGQKMSPYGIVLPKRQLFAAGARPVIYGLDGSSSFHSSGGESRPRLLDEESLPLQEQYRYVAFDPTRDGKLDWSHEREWRWPTPEPHPNATDFEDLERYGLDPRRFSGGGFIVKTERQARLLLLDILADVDSGRMSRDTFEFIFVRDRFPDETELISPSDRAAALSESRIQLSSFFSLDDSEIERLHAKFDRLVEEVASTIEVDEIEPGELGKCWLWLRDNTSPLVRALVARPNVRGVEINSAGKYLVPLPEFRDDTGLRFREDLTKELARRVEAEFDTEATYYSVLGSDNADGVQWYTGKPFGEGRAADDPYLNYAHHEQDF